MAEAYTVSQTENEQVLDLALDTLKKGKQALIFVNTIRSSEKTAEDIARAVRKQKMPYHKDILDGIAKQVLEALSKPTKQCLRLSLCAGFGIAFHHSGLTSEQRHLIEDSFKKGHIKIICSTPTLAMGIDLPAFRAIIRDWRRYGMRGLEPIPVLEYHQMAGRAGRPKYDSFGEAILIAKSEGERDKLVDEYIFGKPEPIYSKLAVEPVLRTYVLSLIASSFVREKQQLLEFFEHTFWAHQFKDIVKLEHTLFRILEQLQDWGFLYRSHSARQKAEFVSASELGMNVLKVTPIGKRVSELYIDPYSAHHLIESMRKAHLGKEYELFSFLQMITYTREMMPRLHAKMSEMEDINEKLVLYSGKLFMDEPKMFDYEYDDFLDSVKTALFFFDWMNESDEEFLLEKYSARPGEVRAKLEKAEWLLYACSEIARMMQMQPLLNPIAKVRVRLDYGVKEELLPLVRLKGIGRARARRLYNNGVRDLGDVKKTDVLKLTQILGKGIALDVKKQVGEDMGKMMVPERKRKGQMGLGKY